jgi:hypothetical protein
MRRSASVALIATGLLLGSCSKTQDTAPETRLFGAAPVIENAQLVRDSSVGTASCDMTDAIKGYLCANGYRPSDIDFTDHVFINVHYTEAEIQIQAIDPDTKPGGQNDILLVGASYQSSSSGTQKFESTLVVLDDGGGATGATNNQFTFQQRVTDIQQACQPDPNLCADPNGVSCGTAIFKLNSNDPVANDNTWTRGFALLSGSTTFTGPPGITPGTRENFVQDCVAGQKHQFPVLADVPVGTPVTFKIEVVDRAGNLTQWPQPLGITFDKTVYDCSGDVCGCCLLLSNQPDVECKGKPGLVGPGYPNGWCIAYAGP